MYGWYATGWAHGKGIPVISSMAASFKEAQVEKNRMDERMIGEFGTLIWRIIGL